MAETAKTLLEWLKIHPKYLIGLALVCLVLVGLPQSWRAYLGYQELIAPYRGWLSVAGVACLVYACFISLAGVSPWVQRKWSNWRFRRTAPKRLRALPSQEKGCLAEYLARDASTLYFSLGDGIVRGLEGKGVIYRASEVSMINDVFGYNLQPWVLSAVKKDDALAKEIMKCSGRGPSPQRVSEAAW